jgi:hypothetical protein
MNSFSNNSWLNNHFTVEIPTRYRFVLEFIISNFLKAQHVSNGTPLIIRSSELYLQRLVYMSIWWPAVTKAEWAVPTQPWQRPVTIWAYKPEAANTVLSSWWWAVCRSKHVETLKNFGIINSSTKATSCWYFYWVFYDARIDEYQIYKQPF